MARGRVVVAADRGGPAEVIESGRDGLLYRMGCQDSLTRTLERVAAGGEPIAELRERARDTARHYHPQRTGVALRGVLDRVRGR
jgi:glycosyltransferase involved in cell wall biosynthesis